jgi:hypothetical protein
VTDRDVWIKAAEIFGEHGDLSAAFIIGELSNVLDDKVAVEDWRRIAAAVDAIAYEKRAC